MFHPVKGCLSRLQEKQHEIDTDFEDLRKAFKRLGAPEALLASIIRNAPARLSQLKQQLADCLHWELRRHGEHICYGIEVSETTIQALHAEVNQLAHFP